MSFHFVLAFAYCKLRKYPTFFFSLYVFILQVQPEYLQLFEFVGKMVGKAVYEGHLMDLPLAPFFVNLVVGRPNTLNELAQLDPEVSKNLQFVKTYDGNVEDLDLYFAVDEELFGKVG